MPASGATGGHRPNHLLIFMSYDSTDGAGGGAFAPDNARQMIETASVFAQREMLPEARQALQRARGALSRRSDVGPAHWCNACLVALEIAARGGDVQGLEFEAAQLRSLSGGGQYWSEQARARIGKGSGRVDPARLDRVFAVLAGEDVPSSSAPPPAAELPAFRVSDARPPAREGTGRGLIAPMPRSAAPVAAPPEPAPPVEAPSAEVPAAPALAAPELPAQEDAPTDLADPFTEPSATVASLHEPLASEAALERVYPGAAWGGAAWMGSASQDPPADREASDDTGPVDARLRVAPDRTDPEELLRSFVDHVTRWRDDVGAEEAERFYDLGTSFLEMDQWESAVRVFDQAMRNPGTRVAAAEGYLKALMGMGGHHAAFGAAGMALSHLADAGEPLSGILFLRGQAAEVSGDPREARRCYVEALRIDRFYVDARDRLAALGE